MAIKVIIFDFDGTIADTYQAVVDITNGLSTEFGYEPLDEDSLKLLKDLSSKDIVRHSEISLFKLTFLLRRVRKELGKQIQDLEPISDMPEVLKKLKQHDYTLGIITSNAEENVTAFLQKRNLDRFFDFVYSGATIFGKHRIIRRIIKKYRFDPKEVIYVGDETRDIRSAQKSNVGVIAVTWGFNSDKILSEYNPDFLVEKPSNILNAIAEL